MLLYLQTPKSEEEWQAIAKNFVEKWQFPHCLGALDGKHIYIQPPAHSGSMWHNYKGRFSVLITLVLALRAGSRMLGFLPILI